MSAVATENNISLEEMLTQEQHADLAKEALESFVNKILYGEIPEISVEITPEIEAILEENNITMDELFAGMDNETLTEIIEEVDDETAAEIILNLDDDALQDYVGEIIAGEHPSIAKKPVIKEIIKVITEKAPEIKEETDYESGLYSSAESTNQELVTGFEDESIKIDNNVEEILGDKKYAPKIKSAVENNTSLGYWLTSNCWFRSWTII